MFSCLKLVQVCKRNTNPYLFRVVCLLSSSPRLFDCTADKSPQEIKRNKTKQIKNKSLFVLLQRKSPKKNGEQKIENKKKKPSKEVAQRI